MIPFADLRLLDAGAVGCNIEDSVHSEDNRLRSASEHAEFVTAMREAACPASSVRRSSRARSPAVSPRAAATGSRVGGQWPPAGDPGVAGQAG